MIDSEIRNVTFPIGDRQIHTILFQKVPVSFLRRVGDSLIGRDSHRLQAEVPIFDEQIGWDLVSILEKTEPVKIEEIGIIFEQNGQLTQLFLRKVDKDIKVFSHSLLSGLQLPSNKMIENTSIIISPNKIIKFKIFEAPMNTHKFAVQIPPKVTYIQEGVIKQLQITSAIQNN